MAVTYGFDHVHLNATDVEAAAAFYERVFGMRRLRTFEVNGVTFTQLDAGGTRVTITSRPYQHSGRGNAVDHFALYVPNLEEAIADLQGKGVEFRQGEQGRLEFRDTAGVADAINFAFIHAPDGVAVEILQRPAG